MKVILVNGSVNEFGCTYTGLNIIKERLKEDGVDSEIIWIGDEAIDDWSPRKKEKDIVDVIGEKMKTADGLIVGSPTWFSHPTGRLMCVLDRLSRDYNPFLAYKPASAILSARRAGQVIANDIITKHFTNNNMLIVSSTYWNLIFGSKPSEVLLDLEGVATMKNLADNMAWIIKVIKKADIKHPEPIVARTNFHR